MGHIIDEVEHGVRTVAGVEVSVRELVWNDLGRSFEVHWVDTGDDLTEDGCFDILPTDEQITDLLALRQPDWWICQGCGTRTGADLIVDHVRDCDLVDGAGNPIGDMR